jgi:hypothetical protein
MMAPRIQRWGAGLSSRINARPPETVTDYSDIVARFKVPVVSHEMGEWCVYPNLRERAKYTGVMRALNFDIFADSLAAHGMSDLADDFLYASGKLQALCYKEDIESALRTTGLGGFQLLDLHDFPGQGTALVGVLDPFWEQKGYITPAEYHRFCGETVPLALLPKRVFQSGETLSAEIKIAHFGPAPLQDAVVRWQLTDVTGTTLLEGAFPRQTIPLGNSEQLGVIETPLPEAPTARKLRLVVEIENTPFLNDWDLWVYPRQLPPVANAKTVHWRHALNAETLDLLQRGERVILQLAPKQLADGPATGFSSIFWNTAWTGGQPPHTLGILCDPTHPVFAHFPTEAWSNWQWWYLVHNAQAMVLDPLPHSLRPLVRMIDDWVTNRRLALLFEARVGSGRLLVSSLALDAAQHGEAVSAADNLPARQFRYSLEQYAASERFQPEATLTAAQLRSLLRPPSVMREQAHGRVLKASSYQPGYEASRALDNDPSTFWHTAWGAKTPPFPHQLEIGFSRPMTLAGVKLLPRQDHNRNGRIKNYRLEASPDGESWQVVAKGKLGAAPTVQVIRFSQPVTARAMRLTVLSSYSKEPAASLAEWELIPARP